MQNLHGVMQAAKPLAGKQNSPAARAAGLSEKVFGEWPDQAM